jgi:DNA-binding NtrC family response regulator
MQEQLLVVEADAALQLSLSAMLRREGYSILVARTLAEAQELLLQDHLSVVLLDLSLLDGDLQGLSQLSATPHGPLVVAAVPGEGLESAVAALRAGAFDYLSRPINHELLLASVQRAAEHHRLRSSARESERLRDSESARREATRTAAYHISQHLTVIMGETQLLQKEDLDADTRAGLERILRATELAAQTLVDLRGSRPAGGQTALDERPLAEG